MLVRRDACDMGQNIIPLVLAWDTLLSAHALRYYLDWGTLLGAVRDSAVIPYEFDGDVSVFAGDYETLLGLKGELREATGFHLYGRKDYIWRKAYYTMWKLRWDPYLGSFPCLRLYDEAEYFYLDIYCQRRVERPADLWANITEESRPPGYKEPGNAERPMYHNGETEQVRLWWALCL